MPVKNLRDGTIKVQVDNDGGGNAGEVEVTLDEGNLSWTEARPVAMISDRGTLDHARRAPEDQLVELTFTMLYQSHTNPNSAVPTVYEALTKQGAAAAWMSQNFGDSDDYSVNLEFTVVDPAGGADEVINFDLFNPTVEDFQEGTPVNTLTITGTAPLYWVDFWWSAEDSLKPRIGSLGTFTRAGTATSINAAGQIAYAKAGEFRSAHHPNSGGRTGLLEAQRSNGWTFSEDLGNAAWTKTRASISDNAAVGPDGYTTLDKLVEDATAAASHEIARNTPALTDNTDYTFTVFAKAAERTLIKISMGRKDGTLGTVFVDISDGTIGTQANLEAVRVETLANGLYRIETVTNSQSGGATPGVTVNLTAGAEVITYNGDGSSGCYLWGLDIEVDQPFASSYIPTTVYPLNGDGYFEFSGAAGNFASSPDAAALDITGDIDVRCRAALDAWSGTAEFLIAKWDSVGQQSYALEVLASGVIRLLWSNDGTATVLADSTVATGITNGAIKWVRATLDVDDGGGNRVINFYTSDDGENWTQLGAAVTVGATTSIFSSTSPLEIGSLLGGTSDPLAGKIYRAQVYDGIAGTLVFDADPQDTTTHGATRITLTEKANSAVVTTFATSAAATRVTDNLYFPLPISLSTPKESTWYFRLMNWVNAYVSGTISHIGSATAASDPRWDIDVDGSGDILANYDGGSTDADTSVVSAPADGETVELRTPLSSAGVVGLGSAIDFGAEVVETPAAGDALGAAWADTRLYLNSTGSTVPGFGNYAEVIGARRTRTLEHLRKVG